MSNEDQKYKHSLRMHREESAIRKQVAIAKSHGMVTEQSHMYVKHHAMNCGNSNCFLCGNPRKIFNEQTIQERGMFQKELIEEDLND